MSTVISVVLDKYGWEGRDNEEVVNYIVTMSDREANAQEVLAAVDLPKVGATLQANPLLSVQKGGISARREDRSSNIWRVEVRFTEADISIQNFNLSATPRLRDFNFSNKIYTRVAKKCYERYFENESLTDTVGRWVKRNNSIDAKKEHSIFNTAYQEFAAGTLNEEYSQLVVSWTQEEDSNFDYTDIRKYVGSINAKPVTILGMKFNEKQVKIRDITPTTGYDEDGNGIWLGTYTIEIAETDWINTILNAGFRAEFLVESTNGNYFLNRQIKQADVISVTKPNLTESYIKSVFSDYNDVVNDPWPLDKDGEMIQVGISDETVTDPLYAKFRTLPMIDFNDTLNLISDKIEPEDQN